MHRPVLAASIVLSSAGLAQATLITNGDFATGDLTGWSTVFTAPDQSTIAADGANGNPASAAKLDRAVTTAADNKDFLYQIVDVTVGEQYVLNAEWSGDLRAGGGTATNSRNWAEVYVAFFPSDAAVTDTATQLPDALIRYKKRWDVTGGPGNSNTFNVDQATGTWGWESILTSPDTAATPGPSDGVFAATDEFMFVGFNIGGRAGSGAANFLVDNVSITVVPEPGTATVIGVLAAGGLLLRRRP